MRRVVLVSNRVLDLRKAPQAGGVAVALADVVRYHNGLWFGWNGEITSNATADAVAREGRLATVPLSEADHQGYYLGYANSVLWPALHSRPDLIRATTDDYRCYREVNAFMARGLLRFGRADATYWVHDYHFLTLGAELRRLGPRVEQHAAFPRRTNVQLAHVVDRRTIELLIWERGAGETQASGSSSCAVVAAAQRDGLVDAQVTARMPGGELAVRVDADGRLWQRGPVEEVARITPSPALIRRLQALP